MLNPLRLIHIFTFLYFEFFFKNSAFTTAIVTPNEEMIPLFLISWDGFSFSIIFSFSSPPCNFEGKKK